MNAVETLIMQAVLKSVKDYNYNNSIEMLEHGVKKYFKDNYDEVFCSLDSWKFIDDGNNIEITYTKQYLSDAIEYNTDVVPLETIVCIAVELSFNKN